MVAHGQEVGAIPIEQLQPAAVIVGDAFHALLRRCALAQGSEVPHVAKVYAVLRLPVLDETFHDLDSLRADKIAVCVG